MSTACRVYSPDTNEPREEISDISSLGFRTEYGSLHDLFGSKYLKKPVFHVAGIGRRIGKCLFPDLLYVFVPNLTGEAAGASEYEVGVRIGTLFLDEHALDMTAAAHVM